MNSIFFWWSSASESQILEKKKLINALIEPISVLPPKDADEQQNEEPPPLLLQRSRSLDDQNFITQEGEAVNTSSIPKSVLSEAKDEVNANDLHGKEEKPKKNKGWHLFPTNKSNAKHSEKSNKPDLRRTKSFSLFKKRTSKMDTESKEASNKNATTRSRFKSFSSWKEVFEPKATTGTDGYFVDAKGKPVLEKWMIKRFFHYANFKLERKLLLGFLEKASIILSLCEAQAVKSKDDNMALLLNSLNGYFLCLRFGAAKKNLKERVKNRNKNPRRRQSSVSFNLHGEDKSSSGFSSNDGNEGELPSTLNNIKTAGLNAFQNIKLSEEDLEKNRNLLLKGNRNNKVQEIQGEAVDGLYEAIVLFILEVKEDQKKKNPSGGHVIDVEFLAKQLMENFKERLFTMIDHNQKFIASTLESIYTMNELIFEPSVSNFLFIASIKNLIKTHWKEFMKYIKEATSALLDLIREEYLLKYLQTLMKLNVFTREWKYSEKTGRLMFDERDTKSKEKMKEFLDSGYIQLEHYIFSLSHFSLKNLEKIITS